jgi:hypothetical protein
MLTQLSTVKGRLGIDAANPQYDALLTNAIKSLSARFDKETNRTLARTVAATHEFPVYDTEISPPSYPIETVTKFELKTSEATGWQEQSPAPDYLIRNACIISLPSSTIHHPSSPCLARVTYTGGYVLPGDNLQLSTFNFQLLPDLEQAAAEQVAFWFQNREHLGLQTYWPSGVAYLQFAALDLLQPVQATLSQHRRWNPLKNCRFPFPPLIHKSINPWAHAPNNPLIQPRPSRPHSPSIAVGPSKI